LSWFPGRALRARVGGRPGVMGLIRDLAASVVMLYGGAVAAWLILRLLFPDSRWSWLALASTFALYLFVPLLLILPLAWLARSRWAWRAAAFPLFVFLWMFGGLFLPNPPAGQGDGPTLTVMTFNVWGFNNRAASVASVIRRVDPDVVLLQETRGWMASDLREELGEEYPYVVLPYTSPSGMLSIFSRYPILSSEWVSSPSIWRWAQHAVLDIDGRQVHVVNLHLSSSSSIWRLRDLTWRLRSTYIQREKEARTYQAFLSRLDGPVIVAGDFNTTDQTTAYHILTKGLRDAFRTAGWGLGHTYPAQPWRFRRFLVPARLVRIDYITYSPHWSAVRAYIGPWDGVSDHLPVVAELRLR